MFGHSVKQQEAQGAAAPIAVFAYNRPDKIAAFMTTLQACHGFSRSEVTIFVDGPKSLSDAGDVEAVRAFVRALDLPNVSWSFQDTNRGLRASVFAGVNEIISKHGRVIVFEDDLMLSPIALDYFNLGLQRYQDDSRVWSVVGYIYDAPVLRGSRKAVVLPFTHPWGWATWSRAWHRFDLDNRPDAETLRSSAFKQAFNLNGLYPFSTQLLNSINGRVNSWFIHWYFTVFQHGGVSVFPPRRILDNYGLNAGSHGGGLNPQDWLVRRPPLLDTLPDFCDPCTVDYAVLDELHRCRELRVQRFIARAGSLRRATKALLG